jgi:hypothetical protein
MREGKDRIVKNEPQQTDLFTWAESRPSAVILDARPKIERRIRDYVVHMAMTGIYPDKEAKAAILPFGRRGDAG